MGAESMVSSAMAGDRTTMLFTYGTLKRGFSNHGLLQDMIRSGDAAFVGAGRTTARLPLVCGPYCVPFLLNLPGAGERVAGELYALSPRALARVDDLEGTERGHYERFPIQIEIEMEEEEKEEEEVEKKEALTVAAEAYFAHRSYAGQLWRRSGERGFPAYSEREAQGYVRRKDRPQDTTFLDQIRIFVESRDGIRLG